MLCAPRRAAQVTAPVLWENIVGTLLKDKAVSKSYEIGPNKVPPPPTLPQQPWMGPCMLLWATQACRRQCTQSAPWRTAEPQWSEVCIYTRHRHACM